MARSAAIRSVIAESIGPLAKLVLRLICFSLAATITNMKIAVAGKGGSGKTTIAGTLARVLARRGLQVLAIDGDTNPNLGISTGIPRERLADIPTLPGSLLQRVTDTDGKPRAVLTMAVNDIKAKFGVLVRPNLTLLEMARVDHAGAG